MDYHHSSVKRYEVPAINDKSSNVSNIYLKSKSASSLMRKKSLLKRQNSGQEGENMLIKAPLELNKQKFKLESYDFYSVFNEFY